MPTTDNIDGTKDTQINIRVDSELFDELKAQAREEVTNASQLVRKALTLYLRKHRKCPAS